MMEGEQDLSPSTSNVDTSQPSPGFSLGSTLPLIIVLTFSGILSCCYHREKFCSFQTPLTQSNTAATSSHHRSSSSNSNINSTELKQNKGQIMPVLMPGDDVPKFIAMPCPRKPSLSERIIVTVEKPPPAPKPPRMRVPLLNYQPN